MSTIHASAPLSSTNMMNSDPQAPANLSALGKALTQTTISSPSADEPASPNSLSMAPVVTVASTPPTPAPSSAAVRKSPKKRERTDSMKKAIVAPAAQRAKSSTLTAEYGEEDDDHDEDDDDEDDDDDEELDDDDAGDDGFSDTSSNMDPLTKLPVKDRTGSAIAGISRVTLISNAVKTAPPAKEKSNPRRWSKAEDESLRLAVERSGERNWKAIAEQVPGRNHTQCLQRWTKVLKPGLIKGHWDPEEDAKLRDLVAEGKRNWGQVASLIPGRTSKQCRERWCNHLDPNINKGVYTEDEDRIILEMQAKLGNRWSIIAQHLKGRTEDAVKIRWKSLMRGKKAAGKESPSMSSSSADNIPTTTTAASTIAMSHPSLAVSTSHTAHPVQHDVKPARTPTKQKTRAASPVAKNIEPIQFKPEPMQSNPTMQQNLPQPLHIPATNSVSLDSSGAGNSIDSKHVAASINSYMQNVNDIVAASIHNFRLNQNFSPGIPVGVAQTTASSSAPSVSKSSGSNMNMMAAQSHASMMPQSTISPMNQPVYAMHPQQSYHGIQQQQHQQQHRSYQAQPQYQMQANMNLPPNYVLPTTGMANTTAHTQHFPVGMQSSNGIMSMHMASYGQYGTAMMADGRTMPMQHSAQHGYQTTPGAMAGYPNGMGMVPQQYAMAHGLSMPPPHPHSVAMPPQPEPLAPVSAPAIPQHVASSAVSKLATPREEWGSSQTPRSHLIMTEGHASAYELFHQQRLRLMLKERDKGMSLTSAPSPGQAMLTKELKANKERQKRQEMMQQGWKSAVDAMMCLNNDTPSLDDSDELLEKVGLSALDPVDDELMDGSVDITLPTEDGIGETDDPILIADHE